MTDHGNWPAVKFRQARHDGLVIAVRPVTMQLDEVGKQQSNESLGIRPLRMPRDLRALPGAQVSVEFVTQFGNLLSDAFEFRFGQRAVCKVTQLLDIFFQAVDLALPLAAFRDHAYLVFGRHHITRSIDWPPQTSRIAVTNSAESCTRRCTSICATIPSGLSGSKITGLRPGKDAKIS